MVSQAPPADWSFHCNGCGRCCNSPPQMTLAELFRHPLRFIGALALRRVRPRSSRHAALLFHPPGLPPGQALALNTQAIDYPSLHRCPALLDDGRCSLHTQGKPLACTVVPLDALLDDVDQSVVLAERAQGAQYIGADCIVPGPRPGFTRLTQAGALHDAASQQALGAHRAALGEERRLWGAALFGQLLRDLASPADLLARVPPQGVLTLSIAPVLQQVAAASPACHARCGDYLRAQQQLVSQALAQALARKRPEDRAFTEHLRRHEAALSALALHLARTPTHFRTPEAGALERWLGVPHPAPAHHEPQP